MNKRINKTLLNSYYDNIRVLGWVGYSIHKEREGGSVNWEGLVLFLVCCSIICTMCTYCLPRVPRLPISCLGSNRECVKYLNCCGLPVDVKPEPARCQAELGAINQLGP